jgi:hypothetical protein
MNPTAHVRETLRITKLDSILEVCELQSPQEMVGEVRGAGLAA